MIAPDLAVVLVSYNARPHLERCLASLRGAAPGLNVEVVVIDNASEDGSPEAVRARWPDVRLIEPGANLGFARACNEGIRATTGELILLLNSDTIVPPGALETLVRLLRARPDVTVAGPRLVDAAGRPELSFGPWPGPVAAAWQKALTSLHARGLWPVTAWVDRLTRRAHAPAWVTGACLLVRREAAVAAGLLDERYYMYLEDVDFCAAIRRAGGRVLFTPEVEMRHLRGASVAAAPAATAQAYRRSQLAFYAKHHPRWIPLLRAYLRLRGRLPPATQGAEPAPGGSHVYNRGDGT